MKFSKNVLISGKNRINYIFAHFLCYHKIQNLVWGSDKVELV